VRRRGPAQPSSIGRLGRGGLRVEANRRVDPWPEQVWAGQRRRPARVLPTPVWPTPVMSGLKPIAQPSTAALSCRIKAPCPSPAWAAVSSMFSSKALCLKPALDADGEFAQSACRPARSVSSRSDQQASRARTTFLESSGCSCRGASMQIQCNALSMPCQAQGLEFVQGWIEVAMVGFLGGSGVARARAVWRWSSRQQGQVL